MSTAAATAHILVVEDDRDIRDSVIEVLEEEGYVVTGAGDGAEALRALEHGARRPDLILLDLMMPIMNGFQFREQQLKAAEHASIPIVLITADGNANHHAQALGAAGYIRKPVKIQPLLDLVAKVLGR